MHLYKKIEWLCSLNYSLLSLKSTSKKFVGFSQRNSSVQNIFTLMSIYQFASQRTLWVLRKHCDPVDQLGNAFTQSIKGWVKDEVNH